MSCVIIIINHPLTNNNYFKLPAAGPLNLRSGTVLLSVCLSVCVCRLQAAESCIHLFLILNIYLQYLHLTIKLLR